MIWQVSHTADVGGDQSLSEWAWLQKHQSSPLMLNHTWGTPTYSSHVLSITHREAGVLLQPNAEVPPYTPFQQHEGRCSRSRDKSGEKEEEKEEILPPLKLTSPSTSTSDNTLTYAKSLISPMTSPPLWLVDSDTICCPPSSLACVVLSPCSLSSLAWTFCWNWSRSRSHVQPEWPPWPLQWLSILVLEFLWTSSMVPLTQRWLNGNTPGAGEGLRPVRVRLTWPSLPLADWMKRPGCFCFFLSLKRAVFCLVTPSLSFPQMSFCDPKHKHVFNRFYILMRAIFHSTFVS